MFVSLSPALEGRAQTAAAVPVVTSILPVHSLVAGVMDGVGTPHLLVPGGASPHSFALRPSDARRLEAARAVFWIGPDLETFLERPLNALARNAEVIALADAEGVTRLPVREGGSWETHDHDEAPGGERKDEHGDGHKGEHAHKDEHAGEADHHHGAKESDGDTHGHGHGDAHDHGDWNVHVWLDPQNAIAFVDPGNKARYDANSARLAAKLRTLDGALQRKLAPVKGKPYIVFHDAYQNFEARYGLTAVGSITISPELGPGARRLVEIRERIRETGALCVFAEPQFEPKVIRTVVQGTGARTGTLDPLGAGLEPGPDAYFQLLQNLAADLTACLGGRR
jgi:zinc transport system substrate-binding protein